MQKNGQSHAMAHVVLSTIVDQRFQICRPQPLTCGLWRMHDCLHPALTKILISMFVSYTGMIGMKHCFREAPHVVPCIES